MTKSKISEVQRAKILADFGAGVSAYRIAKNLNVSTQYVWYILNPEKLQENRKRAKERSKKQ